MRRLQVNRSREAAQWQRPAKGTGKHMLLRWILGFIGAVFAGVLLISLIGNARDLFQQPPDAARVRPVPQGTEGREFPERRSIRQV